MILIPNVPKFQGSEINAPDARQVNMRLAPALAVNAAIAGPVAEAIGGIGEHFQGVADRAQKLENARAESEARMQLDSGYSQLQIDLEKDPDPVSRINKTREYFEQSKGIAENPNLSPQVRDSLRQFHTEFSHKGNISAAADGAKLAMKRATLQHFNELNAAVLANDQDRIMSIGKRMVDAGIQLPEEWEATKVRIEQTLKEQADQKDVIEDPKTWQENNPANKVPAGTDPARYQRMQDFAAGQMRKKTYEASADIMDAIVSGAITDEKQLDELTQDLRPTAVEELKNALRSRQAKGYKEKADTPEFQMQVYGQVSKEIEDFNPNAEDADARIARISGMMQHLKPGFLKDKVTRAFRTAESPEAAKNYGEFLLEQFSELRKAGRFGKTVEPENILLSEAVKDNFLKDTEKIQRLGYSKDQAELIKEAATKSPELGQRKLIDLAGERPGGSVNASEIENATFNALRLGHSTIPWSTEDSKKAAAEVNLKTAGDYGRAKAQMETFLRLEPNASKEDMDAAYLRITGKAIMEKYDTTPDKPAKPSKDSSTSMNGPGVNPNVPKLWDIVSAKYPSIENWGIWGDEKHKNRKSDHNTGDAIDIAIAKNDGNQIAKTIEANATAYNVKYMIHNSRIWKPSTGWQPYTGSHDHSEHIHVSFNRS